MIITSKCMSFTANSTGGLYNHSMVRDDIGYIYYGALLNSNGNQMGVHDHNKNMKTKILFWNILKKII